jgi:hypothetical protein
MTEQIKNQYDSLYSSKEVFYGEGKPLVAVCGNGDSHRLSVKTMA